MAARSKKTYDHRLVELVRRTGDAAVATRLGVPRSTAAGWLNGSTRTVVTVDTVSMPAKELQAEVVRLRSRIQRLRSVIRILAVVIRAFDVDLTKRRLPEGHAKATILGAIDRARQCLSLRSALRILNLSAALSRLEACREDL